MFLLQPLSDYAVATISRLLQIVGLFLQNIVSFAEYRLFCRISSLLQGSFAKETYNFKEPTNRSHPICAVGIVVLGRSIRY